MGVVAFVAIQRKDLFFTCFKNPAARVRYGDAQPMEYRKFEQSLWVVICGRTILHEVCQPRHSSGSARGQISPRYGTSPRFLARNLQNREGLDVCCVQR